MVKTYNCSFNRNMYLWWCSNGYKKRLQSFIGRYFYCAFLGSSLGIDSNVHAGVGKFGCNWLEWWKGIWQQIFENCQIPKSPPYALPPPPARQLNIDGCISLICRIWFLVILLDMKRMLKGISMKSLIKKSRYWILVYGKSKNFENTVICMKLSTLASSSFLYVLWLERNAGKVYYNFYQTFLLMYFVSSVILQCVAVNYSIQAFKTTNVSVCVCCGLILSLV